MSTKEDILENLLKKNFRKKRMKQANAGTGSKNAFAKWLEQRCLDEGLSLRKTAAKADLSHATVADIINGGRPSADTIRKLAAAFSGNGRHQKVALEDYLLILCGYRSARMEGELSEPLARLMDKLSQLNDEQLRIVEQFIDFAAKCVEKN